jgi:hypothetical protein
VIAKVVSKYCVTTLRCTGRRRFWREAGLEIGPATLDGWVVQVGEMLQPVGEAMPPQS